MDDHSLPPSPSDWNPTDRLRRRHLQKPKQSMLSRWIGTLAFIVVVISLHGAIAYFGWNWINRQQAPSNPVQEVPTPPRNNATLPQDRTRTRTAPRAGTTAGQIQPESDITTGADDGNYEGRMRWTRRTGLTISPDPKPDWKCAGGYFFETSIGSDGSTVITMVQVNGRPVPCKG